ncbi:MAG: hypothetical protein EAZ55_08605 [Cytophagales bacterium]|nr:MAG: hypothetical protein EAZ55_08605 [Cytophagales bacterium]
MDNHSDKALEAYINKMLTTQQNYAEKPLNSQELKQIALDIGLSEEEWIATQTQQKEHIKAASWLMQSQNYNDALQSYRQAFALNPYDINSIYGLAWANAKIWENTQNKNHKREAEEYLVRALQISPTHLPSLQLQTSLTQKKKENETLSQKSKLRGLIAFASVVALLFISGFYFNQTIQAKKEEIKAAQNQIENIGQRRADVIRTIASRNALTNAEEQKLIAEITKLNQAIETQKQNTKDLQTRLKDETYLEKQKQLSSLIAKYKEITQQKETLPEIIGAENRWSVEKKKYNQIIKEYNIYIKQFPMSLFGYAEENYLP